MNNHFKLTNLRINLPVNEGVNNKKTDHKAGFAIGSPHPYPP